MGDFISEQNVARDQTIGSIRRYCSSILMTAWSPRAAQPQSALLEDRKARGVTGLKDAACKRPLASTTSPAELAGRNVLKTRMQPSAPLGQKLARVFADLFFRTRQESESW